mgnify:FL=1
MMGVIGSLSPDFIGGVAAGGFCVLSGGVFSLSGKVSWLSGAFSEHVRKHEKTR